MLRLFGLTIIIGISCLFFYCANLGMTCGCSCSEAPVNTGFTGTLDTTFGSAKTGVVTVDSESGGSDMTGYITVDSDNNIITAGEMPLATKMWKLDNNGIPVSSFGTEGEAVISEDENYNMDSLTVDPSNNIYIIGNTSNDSQQGNIRKYDSNGSFMISKSPDDIEDLYSSSAAGAAVDSTGNVYFTGGRMSADGSEASLAIWKFDMSDELSLFTRFESGATCSYQPMDLIIDENGFFYVLGEILEGSTFVNIYIWRFYANGELDTAFGTDGRAAYDTAGVISHPSQLAIDSNGDIFATTYIGDSNAWESTAGIWKYNSDTKAIDLFFTPANTFGSSSGISIDSQDNIFMTGDIYDTTTIPGQVLIDAAIWAVDPEGTAITNFFTNGVYTGNPISVMEGSLFDSLGRLVAVEPAFEDTTTIMNVLRFR